ncbi:uncharacterized protein LOC118757336, partial [Rhagoletis pomonella]|uniref:uncharacterized protein LOC118757336 n=1 Tax=Rhagoletis pomonella TaxID=28610 RepID=UPI00177EEE85
MTEYNDLGHMQPVLKSTQPHPFCYIPHHGVYKESSSTTKLRVVFNASRKYSSGVSLNDCLHTGPKLQSDLASLLLKWRLHRVAFMADIEKCFRQIIVSDEDADMQRIFWRNTEGEPQIFRLRTVTYGLNCSPYLTIKVLLTLAKEEEARFPHASKILRESFYMDDCLHGADNVAEAVSLRNELQELVQCGGFTLRKWNSNSLDFLHEINSDICTSASACCNLTLDKETKALGIFWSCASDTIGYKIALTSYTEPITKRQQLSDVAKTYDPIGLLAPVIIVGKIIFQELWVLGCAWDDPIPSPHQQTWRKFRDELPYLESIKIDRWVYTSSKSVNYQLHVFSDASKSAYAAVCYIRVVKPEGSIHVAVLMAKTKVAPLKKIPIPRLELNATLLAAKFALK